MMSPVRTVARRSSSNAREDSIRVLRARIGAVSKKELHDRLLLGARALRAARARRTRPDVERGRALAPVSRVHTSAPLEETADSFGTSCANRAMECSRACLVLMLDVRPGVEEQLNYRSLSGRVPRLSRLGPRIARIVESGCSTPILGV